MSMDSEAEIMLWTDDKGIYGGITGYLHLDFAGYKVMVILQGF